MDNGNRAGGPTDMPIDETNANADTSANANADAKFPFGPKIGDPSRPSQVEQQEATGNQAQPKPNNERRWRPYQRNYKARQGAHQPQGTFPNVQAHVFEQEYNPMAALSNTRAIERMQQDMNMLKRALIGDQENQLSQGPGTFQRVSSTAYPHPSQLPFLPQPLFWGKICPKILDGNVPWPFFGKIFFHNLSTICPQSAHNCHNLWIGILDSSVTLHFWRASHKRTHTWKKCAQKFWTGLRGSKGTLNSWRAPLVGTSAWSLPFWRMDLTPQAFCLLGHGPCPPGWDLPFPPIGSVGSHHSPTWATVRVYGEK